MIKTSIINCKKPAKSPIILILFMQYKYSKKALLTFSSGTEYTKLLCHLMKLPGHTVRGKTLWNKPWEVKQQFGKQTVFYLTIKPWNLWSECLQLWTLSYSSVPHCPSSPRWCYWPGTSGTSEGPCLSISSDESSLSVQLRPWPPGAIDGSAISSPERGPVPGAQPRERASPRGPPDRCENHRWPRTRSWGLTGYWLLILNQ